MVVLCPCIPPERCGSFSTTTSLYPRWPFTWMQRQQIEALMDYLEWYKKGNNFRKVLTDRPKNQRDFNSWVDKWARRTGLLPRCCLCLLVSAACSIAYHKCHAALQGAPKHSLSDSLAGTEQLPASHQSWQGCTAVWTLPMAKGGGGGGRGEEPKRPKGH